VCQAGCPIRATRCGAVAATLEMSGVSQSWRCVSWSSTLTVDRGIWGLAHGPVTGRLPAEYITTGKQSETLREFDLLRRAGH
jgi:hypothetical protein